MPTTWKEVRSEVEIDHGINSVIVGGAPPHMMVNAAVRDGRSATFITGGPYANQEQAQAEAEVLAATHGTSTIYRVVPIRPSKSSSQG